jgi:DNA-binding NtrC family response regulator
MSQLLPQAARGAPGSEVVKARTETVLLVDDEDTVRTMLRLVLQRTGFEVLEARTGNEARRLCQDHRGPIHLLLADALVVPMGSRPLIEVVAQDRPTARVLCISGYPREMLVGEGLIDETVDFLQKPFTPAMLVQKIEEILNN